MRSVASPHTVNPERPGSPVEGALQDRSNAIKLLTGVLDALRGDEPALPATETDTWTSDDLTIELRNWVVRRGPRHIPMTRKEFGLLRILVHAGGAPVPRENLWRPSSGDLPDSSRSLDSHIWSIRNKLEHDPSKPRHLQTVLRVGYRLS